MLTPLPFASRSVCTTYRRTLLIESDLFGKKGCHLIFFSVTNDLLIWSDSMLLVPPPIYFKLGVINKMFGSFLSGCEKTGFIVRICTRRIEPVRRTIIEIIVTVRRSMRVILFGKVD